MLIKMWAYSSFTAEERAYYGSSTIAYKDSIPVAIKHNISPAPEKTMRGMAHDTAPRASREETPQLETMAMAYKGIDLVAEEDELSSNVSWQ